MIRLKKGSVVEGKFGESIVRGIVLKKYRGGTFSMKVTNHISGYNIQMNDQRISEENQHNWKIVR